MVRFSIIASHYDVTVSKEILERFINSLKQQKFKDWECIIVNDGPYKEPIIIDDDRFIVTNTTRRYNMWGHPSREIGLNKAKGEYILHTNTDNVYLPSALETLDTCIVEGFEIYTFPIKMMGMVNDGKYLFYNDPRDYSKFIILSGENVRMGGIDLMQVCASKKIWDELGGFKIYVEKADGYIFEHMAKKFKIRNIKCMPLGEHY